MTQIAIEQNSRTRSGTAQITHVIPKVSIAAFCESAEVGAVVRAASQDRRMAAASVAVREGGLADAITLYRETSSPNLVVVECGDDRDALMAGIDALALECITGTRVIVIGHSNDVDLYRSLLEAGVTDYVVAPLDPIAFLDAVWRCFRDTAELKLGRIVTFIGAKGGTGSSTIAHNAAAAMAAHSHDDVLLADLDLQFGTLGLNFDIEASQGVAEVLEGADRVDDVLLRRIAVQRSERLHLLPAAGSFDRSIDLKEADVDRLLEVARSSSWHLVLDLPHLWTHWTKKMLLSADEIVITATPDLASMRNSKGMVEFLQKARPNDPPPRLVLNKIGIPKLPEIKPKDFAAAVGLDQVVTVPFDSQTFGKAASDGRIVVEVARSSKAARAMSELASKVTGQKDKGTTAKSDLKSMFGLLKR